MPKSLFLLLALLTFAVSHAAEKDWRALPLITNGKLDPAWAFTGYGKFVVDGDAIRTDPASEGLGLLFYKKEKVGNCQLKVVFKTKEPRSNSGIYIRIADGILDQVNKPGASFVRDAAGKPSSESSKLMEATSEREEGPWYAVHNGFEVQIAGGGNPTNGTGSVYSLASAGGGPKDTTTGWKTMLITLDGDKVLVDYEGQRITTFDSSEKNLPARKIWHAPKRENKRPQQGYIGLQTHDPGDIVWFKEVSVRPLPSDAK